MTQSQARIELVEHHRKSARSLIGLGLERERVRAKLLVIEANGSQRRPTEEEAASYWNELRGA